MPQMISLKESKPSKLKRLKFLPRVGVTIDFAGREFTYKNAPILETLANAWKEGLSLQKIAFISIEQLKEISFSEKTSSNSSKEN